MVFDEGGDFVHYDVDGEGPRSEEEVGEEGA